MIKNLAIVGATGAVGVEALQILPQKPLKIENLTLLASPKSAGKEIAFGAQTVTVKALTENSFAGIDYAIFSAGGDQSKKFAPIAVKAGCVVIDNSSAFRMDPDVPLVIPEINPDAARAHKGIIANPNCSTIIMNIPTWPLHQVNPIQRIVVSTYQAASGAGAAAMQELKSQSADILAGKAATPKVLPVQCAFNVFSHNTPIGKDGYNTEERKMIDETHKIFADTSIAITATCIRVPVLRAHSESINLTFTNPITPDQVREILKSAKGVTLVDDQQENIFPMPITASGNDDVLVGRIRQDVSQPDGRGIEMFISGDQLRKGAALNAIQILELLTS